MRKLCAVVAGTLGASAVAMAVLGTGVAAADDYAGQTYGEASAAISNAGKKAVISTRGGDTQSDNECIVTGSESAPWLKGDDFTPVTDTVLLNLNCNAKVASATQPGNSAASPEGRAALKAAKQKQAEAAKQAEAPKQAKAAKQAKSGQ